MAGSRLDGSDRGVALICAIVLFLGMALGSASEASEQDYESRIGVFNDCLSIRNATLEPGTPVTIIRFNSEDENTVSATPASAGSLRGLSPRPNSWTTAPSGSRTGSCERIASSLSIRFRPRAPEC
jgi:hypothetical protein